MDLEAFQALLDNQRLFVKDAIDRIDKKQHDHSLATEKQFTELVKSLEYTQATVEEMEKKMDGLVRENQRLSALASDAAQEIIKLKTQNKKLEDRLDFFDDQSRRKNIRISGIVEESGENQEQCQFKVKKLMKDKLNMEPVFDRVHRLGRPSAHPTQPRDILASFTIQGQRDAAMRKRKNLRGTQVYLNEDFCPATVAIRKNQMGEYHSARNNGKFAFFNYRTLVIKDAHSLGESANGRRDNNTPSSPLPQAHRSSPNHRESQSNTPPRATSTKEFPSLPRQEFPLPTPLSPRPNPDVDPNGATGAVTGAGQRAQRAKKQTELYQASN